MAGLLVAAGLPILAASGDSPPPAENAASTAGTGRPVIKALNPEHDFGKVFNGPVLEHVFKIRNEGNAPLEITRVRPDCGCTATGEHPKNIAPGETGNFLFALDTKKLGSAKFTKNIHVFSNDPATPDLTLKLIVECRASLEVKPPGVFFGMIYGETPQKRSTLITNNTDQPVELKLEGCNAPDKFAGELVEREKGKVYEFHVTTKPPYPKDTTANATFTISTNLPSQQKLTINASITTPDRVGVSPPNIMVQQTGPSSAEGHTADRQGFTRFTNYGETPVKVLEAKTDDPAIGVRISEQTPGKIYNIFVTVPAKHVLPPAGQLLTIKTDDAEKPVFTVPIRPYAAPIATRPALTDAKTTPGPAATRPAVNSPPPVRPAQLMEGKNAPEFSLATLAGKTASSDDFKNHPATVLNFVAPNCGFCKRQLPNIEGLRKDYEAKGIRFVNLIQTMRKEFTNDETVEVMKSVNSNLEIAPDRGNKVGAAYKATTYPTLAIVDRQGTIRRVVIGAKPDISSIVKEALDLLIAGKPVPLTEVTTPPAATQPQVSQPPANPFKEAEALMGKPAPAFTLSTFDGKKAANEDFGNHPATVLNFIAANCGACKRQIPTVESVRKDYEARGIRFINVVQKMHKEFSDQEIQEVMKSLGSNLEIARDKDNTVGSLYKAGSYPILYVIDRAGNVRRVFPGAREDLPNALKATFDPLLNEQSKG